MNHGIRACFRLAAVLTALGNGASLGQESGTVDYTAQWPHWRGPLATGVAPLGQPPVTWSEQENVRWKVRIPGNGTATPIVWQDRVFVLTAIPVESQEAAAEQAAAAGGQRGGRGGFGIRTVEPTGPYRFAVLCLDRQSGKVLWQQVAREELPHEGYHADHGLASGSPITDGEHLFAYFGSRGLYCYDLDGNLKWEQDLGRMQTRNGFGEGTSPALYGDVLVVNWDHEGDDFIVALDKRTGQQLWRQERDEPTTWATPLIVPHDDGLQVVTAATNRIRSYDLETGELVWHCDGLTPNSIPSPVAGNGLVYLTSGFQGSELLAVRLGFRGDLSGSEAIAWSHGRSTPYVPSPLLYGGRLYFFAGNNPILTCLHASTGMPRFGPERLEDVRGVYASPVGADGRVYLVGREGECVVIRHADQLEIVATNQLDEQFDASPAIVRGDLFLRGHEYLYCIAEP